MKSIHIFRPGAHIAMSGQSIMFSEADLAASVAAYNPALHEAPIVVGHPRHDAPAYGWVKSLAANGAGLLAEPHQIDAAFSEMVGAGRFKKVSASFYQPDAPNNPSPGVYYLRHVGFLGAQPPAIKGLRPVEFGEGEAGVVEFSDAGDEISSGLWRRMREWLISQFGQETADRVVSNWEIENMAEIARTKPIAEPASAAPALAFSDPHSATTTKEIPVNEKERADQLEAENQRLRSQLDEENKRKRDAARTANAEFAESLVAAGMKPLHVPLVVAALDFAEDNPDAPLEFGEGDAKKPLAQGLRDIFTEMAGSINFSEQAVKERAGRAEDSNPLLADAEARSKS